MFRLNGWECGVLSFIAKAIYLLFFKKINTNICFTSVLFFSFIHLFADDCVCYRQIDSNEDTSKLQKDIDQLGKWARKWGMRFQPVKCNIMQLTRKQIKKINAV